jgi:hypothetical protein
MVVDLATRAVTATIPVGINPQWCALDAGGEVNVVCSGLFGVDGGQVTFIDSATRAVVDSAHVGGFPGPIAIDSRGIAYMVEFGAGLLTVDTVSNTAIRDVGNPIPVGGLGAFGLAIDQNDRVVVAVSADGLLTVISPDGAIEAAFAVGGGPQDTDLFELVATPVTLTAFSAARSGADVSLAWQVSADASVGGFHVERRTSPRAAFQRLTAGLVTGMEEAPGIRFRYVDRAAGPGALEYRLLALYRDGTEEVLGPFRVASATSPVRFSAVRPNPVRPGPGAAAIELRLDAPGETSVRLLDVAGRPVRALYRGVLAAGTHVLSWDGLGAHGRRLPAGVYFVQVAAPGAAATHKVTVVH